MAAAAASVVLLEEREPPLLGNKSAPGQKFKRLATSRLLAAANNAAVLVLDKIGLGQSTGCVLGRAVKNLSLCSNRGDVSRHSLY